MSALDHPLIDRFLQALWLEKGLSANTRSSYRSDLTHFHGWLHERGIGLTGVSREALGDHLAWRLDQATTRVPPRGCCPACAVSTAFCCEKG